MHLRDRPTDAVLLFGFGSLINSRSRARTLGQVDAWPVRIHGLRRGWYAPSSRIRHTALGVVPEPGATTNGVLLRIAGASLPALDRREAQYERVAIQASRIEVLGPLPPSGPVVTYAPKRVARPDINHPIIRTYVDVTLSGCLEFGVDFARELVDATDAWSEHFEDDRHAPRYPHHEAHAPPDVLDELVAEIRRSAEGARTPQPTDFRQ